MYDVPAVRLARLALAVPAATAVQVAPLWLPSYHHAPSWLDSVSVAAVAVTPDAARLGFGEAANSNWRPPALPSFQLPL